MGKGGINNPGPHAVTGSGSRYVTEAMKIRTRDHRVLEVLLETWRQRELLTGGVKQTACAPEAVRGNLAPGKRTLLRIKPTEKRKSRRTKDKYC